MRKRGIFVVLGFTLAAFLTLKGFVDHGAAQAGITFGPSTVENSFPKEISFYVTVKSAKDEIVEAEFIYARKNRISSESQTREKLDIEAGKEVDLEYTWDTSRLTIPPSMPISFYWRVKDSFGNVAQSEETFIRYDDVRFDWHIMQNSSIAVWWHDKTPSFGQRVYRLAVEAVQEQRQLFNANLTYQIRVIIYNHPDEFNAWRIIPSEWVGGQAFPEYGVTAQIVEGNVPDDFWLRSVIPHEISHLFYAQVTYNPFVRPPYWLNEGIAQFNEHRDYGYQLRLVWDAALSGELIPLSSLEDGFGLFDEERVFLAYEEALSAVLYMVEAFGERSVANLLAAYRQGLSNDEAFQRTFGWTVAEFEANWASWLGVPEGMYVTSTPRPRATVRPSPTSKIWATLDQILPTHTSSPSYTPPPSPTATKESTATSTASPTPQPEEPRDFCPAMLFTLPIMILALCIPLRRSINEKTSSPSARR